MDAVYHILRYLESALGKGLIFQTNSYLSIKSYCDSNWASYADDRRLHHDITCSYVAIWSLGRVRISR
jgi:hypothetical protein